MVTKRYLAFFSVGLMLAAIPAWADGDDDNPCSSGCSDGKVSVSFADGNNVTCVCMEQGNGMEDTVPEAAEQPAEGDA